MADGVSRHRQSAQYEKYTGYTCSKGSHDEDKQNFDHEAPPPILLLYMLFLMMPFGAQHKESTIRKESVRMMAGPVAMFSPAVLMYVPVKAANAPETPAISNTMEKRLDHNWPMTAGAIRRLTISIAPTALRPTEISSMVMMRTMKFIRELLMPAVLLKTGSNI